MSDFRSGVSPVNYPDPDPDIKIYQEYHQSVKSPTKISHRLLNGYKYKHSDIEFINKKNA